MLQFVVMNLPIDSYKKFLKETYDFTWKPKNKKDDRTTSGVIDLSNVTNDETKEDSDVSASVLRKRCVAITNDINIKGQDRWYNGMDFLTDTDGCENLIDQDFSKQELRVPVQTDASPQASIESQGVGGSARFTEYVETKCNFKGVQRNI